MQVRSLGREDPLEEVCQPTPVFLPGASHAQRSPAGYSPWGRTESGMIQVTQHACHGKSCLSGRARGAGSSPEGGRRMKYVGARGNQGSREASPGLSLPSSAVFP